MCGLVGMVGSFTLGLRNVMKDLLFFDSLRGRDSTGLAVVRRSRDVVLKKATVPGYEFIENPNIDQWLGVTDQLWMGHNRFKTVGEASRANAHPFMVLDENDFISTIGAHNGTLRNKYEIEKALEGNDRFGTDSEALMNLIAEVGIKDAIKEAQGAWSLTVWDAESNTLNFIRNRERPLIFAYTKDKKTLIWASETWMILAACRRHNIELYVEEGSDVPCYSTSEDVLYTLNIPQAIGQELPDFTREGDVRGKPEQKFHNGYSGGYASGREFWDRLADGGEDSGTVDGTKQEATSEAGKEEPKHKSSTHSVITIGNPPVTTKDGKSITKAEVDVIRKRGCGWCGGEVTNASPTFLRENTFVCTSCLHGADDRRQYVLRRDGAPKNNVIEIKPNNGAERIKAIVANVTAAGKEK